MNHVLVWFIVKKYLRFDPSQPFITITAILAFLGVMVGVMVLIIAMAIMNGFDNEFKRKLFTMNYPLTLYSRLGSVSHDSLTSLQHQVPHLIFSPFIQASAIAKRGDIMEGVVVFGVDPKQERQVNDVFAKSFIASPNLSSFNITVGSKFLEDNHFKLHDKLTLIFPQMEPGGMGLTPTMKRFSIEGNFTSGLHAYDKSYMYAPLPAIAAIMGMGDGEYTGVHIYSQNPMKDKEKLTSLLPQDLVVIGWWEQNGNFFSALELEKRALFIVLMLIILIASLNIISSLLMTVMNRRKEIALLLSLGTSTHEIQRIFFLLGSVIGLGGIIAGTLLGLSGIFILGHFDIISLPADVYGTTQLPLELSFIDLSLILLGSLVVVLFSSWYPSKKASQINALDTLRHE